MDKEKVREYAEKIKYHLTYFETTHDEARVVESKEYAKKILEELNKE